MPATPDHLLCPASGDIDLLSAWRWKVGAGARLVTASLAGDAFYADPYGCVWWLDTGAGEVKRLANSESEFWRVLSNPEQAHTLLLQPVVESFLQAHGPLPPDRCIGFTFLPVLGGSYAGENRVPLPIAEHFLFTGELHQQLLAIPPGSKVRIVVE